jgi:uncharacterized protein (TIGR03435 family)
MSPLAVRAATALVRGWTWLYTRQLPVATRDRRRAEIASDLWAFQCDVADGGAYRVAAHILARLVLGIPDDLGWCVEEALAAGMPGRRTIAFGGRAAGAAFFIGALWAIGVDVGRDHAIVVLAPGLAAQSPARGSVDGPRVEVASVKPNSTGRAGPTQIRVLPGGRFVATNVPVGLLIGRAYGVPAYRLVGGPNWLMADAFDIIATANGDLTPAGPQRPLAGALQALLAERFKLIVHTETRQLPAYALVFARDDQRLGPSLTRSERTDCAAILAEVAARAAGGPPPPPLPGGQAPPCGAFTSNGLMSLDSATVSRFTDFLSGELNRKVFDRTALAGFFNVHLRWTPDPLPAGPLPADVPPIDLNGPSIFTAVQEQLGLKLQSITGPVDVLVIDSVERPTPN